MFSQKIVGRPAVRERGEERPVAASEIDFQGGAAPEDLFNLQRGDVRFGNQLGHGGTFACAVADSNPG